MTYYIKNAISTSLFDMVKKSPSTFFLKDYEKFWEKIVIGCAMTFEEVLDSLILENHIIQTLDNDYFFPVKFSFMSNRLPSILNLTRIFLQIYNVYFLIPTFFSVLSSVLEFSTTYRKFLYGGIDMIFFLQCILCVENFLIE